MAKLTTKFVTKVQSDNIKVFWDDQLKGFGLCVRPSGKKTFLLIDSFTELRSPKDVGLSNVIVFPLKPICLENISH